MRPDYPRAKLEVLFLIEADDAQTRTALEAAELPSYCRVIVVPNGYPRTKPRALNFGLALARGEILVVYDAEDLPAPGQLRTAAARFLSRPASVACLQAALHIDGFEKNWLTLMFGLDYAALFGIVKPGLATARLPIPLGGTSNHFRTDALRHVGGWDAWNVTEEIDLGFRLARFGYGIETIVSTTSEEAPLTVARWLAQRSRWLKGWMVTLVVHTRQPGRLFRELGPAGGFAVSVALLGTVTSSLFGPLFWILVLVRLCQGSWLTPTDRLEALGVASSIFLVLTGIVGTVLPVAIALKRMRRLDLWIWLPTLPLYLGLVSLATWRALAEYIRDPQRWNKTEHGLVERGATGTAQAASPAVSPENVARHPPLPLFSCARMGGSGDVRSQSG